MATLFSSATATRSTLQPKKYPHRTFMFFGDSYNGGPLCPKCKPSRVNVYSWSSSASYVKLQDGNSNFLGKPILSRRILHKRGGIVKAATIEEIEAEKSSIEKDVKARMEKTVENVRSNFNSIRTGRSSPAMLDKIEVEYYGTPVGLKTIAQVSTPDSSSLLIQPYDKSSACPGDKIYKTGLAFHDPQSVEKNISNFDNLKAIEKAIVTSDLGMTPNNDGDVIRLTLPQLTSERRKELSKVVSKQAEEGKVALRNIRRDALKAYEKLEKEKKLSEDNVKDLSSDLQKLTDEYMKKIDAVYKQKEQELLKV